MKYLNFSDELAAQKYQMIFSIFLIAMAFLFRESTGLVYPQILYLSLLMLAFNFGAGYSLRAWPHRQWISALVTVGNCAVISALVSYSGGPESNLWVLYLLPIYTVCLLLDGKEVFWITAGAMSFNAAIYVSRIAQWTEVISFELAMKSGILSLSGFAIWSVVKKERSAREGLGAKRREIARLADEIKLRESGLEETRKLAELGEVSSGIAHDLSSPLGVILATVELIQANPDGGAPNKEDIERIARAALLCKSIAANILSFLRKETWKTQPCAINEIVESVASLQSALLHKENIRLEINLAPGLQKVEASRVHLQRVILNLCSNAAQALGRDGVIAITTRPYAGFGTGGINIVIEDTGPGIAPQIIEKMFSRFQTTKAPGEGTGLGLYFCREILLKHGGSITAENRPEGGARFSISLPGIVTYNTAAPAGDRLLVAGGR